MNKMNKIGKIDLYCIKCLQVTDNSTIIKLKHEIDGLNRPYYNCIDCVVLIKKVQLLTKKI